MISTFTTVESSMTHRKRDRHIVLCPLDTLSSIPKCLFEDLKYVDNGAPQVCNAKILRMSRHSRSAFVDVGRRTIPKKALTAGVCARVLSMLRFKYMLPSSSDFCYQFVPATNNYDKNDYCDNDDISHQKLKPIPLIVG